MRKPSIKTISLSAVAAVSVLGLSGGPLMAQSSSQMYQANLSTINKSGSTGTANVKVNGNEVTVSVNTTGASPSLPHAQHLHIGGNNTCPTSGADKDNDGLISTAEGQPAYGEVKVSLTTEGDTGADSALAVERFPVADANGTVSYERTFTLPNGVTADDVSNAVVVQHGISELFEDKAKYDGEKKSSLKDDLPLEATIPSVCGKLTSIPSGGVGAGGGSTAGVENMAALAIGAVSLATAGGVLAYSLQRRNNA